MADVLTLTIPLGGRYPSRNQEGRDNHRFGRKSDEYRDLTRAVIEAAKAEMARTGWETAECECLTIITRYMPNHLRADSLNIGSAECNALTAAGVWSDDRLAQPCLFHIRYDDEGPHRVSIVVMKLYEPAHVRIVEKAKPIRKRRAVPDQPASSPDRTEKYVPVGTDERLRYTGGDIPEGYALVGNELVPYAEALAMITKKSA